jgi:AcrR family transcriptional regulator
MIAAMVDVVSERGRSNATVAHVVAHSGVSRRTYYEVFDDFEDCFLAALDQSIARASEYVLNGYDPDEKWRARIRNALIGSLEFLEDEPAMGRLCIIETLGAGRRVYERRLRALDAAIAAIDEGRGESRAASGLPPLTTEGVIGGVLSVLHARLLTHGGHSGRPSSEGVGYPKDAPRAESARRSGGRQGQSDERGGQSEKRRASLLELTSPLMAMIVLPYLGPAAAQRETLRPTPERRNRPRAASADPLRDLDMRLTYRTVRVLLSISAHPGASNREVGTAAGIEDQGQISKLLSRLEKLGLIKNSGAGQVRGAPNAWSLTKRGLEVEQLVDGQTSVGGHAAAGQMPVGRSL